MRISKAAIALGVAGAALFVASPRREAGDGIFALLTSEALVRHGSFDLDAEVPPARLAGRPEGAAPAGPTGPLDLVDGHVRIAAPPGTAILSIPFVPLLARAPAGLPVAREAWAGHVAASLLMGALAGVLYLLARLFVGPPAAALIALASVLGTPVWSVASRGLWSHTWTVLLLAIALLLVARADTGHGPPRPAPVALLLAAAYLTRPDAIGALLPLAIHVVRDPRQRRWFLVADAAAAAAIAVLAWLHTGGHFVWPGLGVAVRPATVPAHLLAVLVSPSRGLLWFVPTTAFVAFLLIRYRPTGVPLVRVSLATIGLHALLQAWNHQWYGGYAYGPRVLTEVVPFVALLAAVGLAARRDAAQAEPRRGRAAEVVTGALLVVLAVAIHARGAWSRRVWQWNSSPTLIDADPSRVWDWHEPQMLAGLVGAPRPARSPYWPTGATLEAASPQSAECFGLGWDAPEGDFRWALGPEAELLFTRAGRTGSLVLRIQGFPHEHPASAPQRMEVGLNGRSMGTLDVGRGAMAWRSIVLDASAFRAVNVVRLAFPDAASPRAMGQGDDERPLGLAVRSLRLDRFPPLPEGGTLRVETAVDHLGPGWGEADGEWRTVRAREALVWFADPPADAALLRVEVEATGPSASMLRLHLNGIELDAIPVPPGGRGTRAVVVPPGALAADNLLRLEQPAEGTVAVASIGLAGLPAYRDEQGIHPARPEDAAHLLTGWSAPETDGSPFRWTDGHEARVVFALTDPGRYRVLRIRLGAFLDRGLEAQRVQVTLNGRPLAPLMLRNALAEEYPLALPVGMLGARNVLSIALPDARSPVSLGTGDDTRVLGVAVESIQLTK